MNIIKPVLISIIGLFLVMTIISLFIPSQVFTVKTVTIHGNKDSIIQEISNLEKWKDWHPVFKSIPADIMINSPGNGVIQQAEWKQINTNNTLQIIAKGDDYTRLVLHPGNSLPSQHNITVQTNENGAALQVQWQAVTQLKWYPWEKFSGIFIEKMSGSGYEDALNGLKNFIEAR